MPPHSILLGIPFWVIAEYIVGAVIGILLMLPFAIAGLTDRDLGEPISKKDEKPNEKNTDEEDIPWEKYR